MGLESGGAGRVGVLAANSLDYAVVAVACQLAGLTLTPLPVLVTPDAQARMIDDADVAVLFHDAATETAARAAIGLAARETTWRSCRERGGAKARTTASRPAPSTPRVSPT